MRRRNAKNAKQRVIDAVSIINNPFDYFGKWHELFGNNNPIHIEIGMGKGKFIIEHARKEPNINFIGIEKYDGVIIQAADRINDDKPANLFLISEDATNLDKIFDKHEVSKVYLNFSDPWPKSRHAKRRLTYKTFLDLYEVISSGEIEFKTDNRPLFEFSLCQLNDNNYQFLDLSLDLHASATDIITTEYEDKFSSQGMPIYFIRTVKRGK